eukprot:9076955-Pyramimonas_sp.AAC.1
MSRARQGARENRPARPRPQRQIEPRATFEDLNSPLISQVFYRPDFALPRADQDSAPALGELMMQDERDEQTQRQR